MILGGWRIDSYCGRDSTLAEKCKLSMKKCAFCTHSVQNGHFSERILLFCHIRLRTLQYCVIVNISLRGLVSRRLLTATHGQVIPLTGEAMVAQESQRSSRRTGRRRIALRLSSRRTRDRGRRLASSPRRCRVEFGRPSAHQCGSCTGAGFESDGRSRSPQGMSLRTPRPMTVVPTRILVPSELPCKNTMAESDMVLAL